MNIPPLRFTLQDAALPIPNLNTSLLANNPAGVTCDTPLQSTDIVNISMISNVLGGDHYQSYSIAQNATALVAEIPIKYVEANEGNSVRLRVTIRSKGVFYVAPDAIVTINKRPIAATGVWGFDDGTFQGWVPQGIYVGGLLRIIDEELVVDFYNSKAGRSHIITRPVSVIAGRTYDFYFSVTGETIDSSVLYMTINGVRIGANVRNFVTDVTQRGTGTYAALTTGEVRLGIFNDAVPSGLHRLILDNIGMETRP